MSMSICQQVVECIFNAFVMRDVRFLAAVLYDSKNEAFILSRFDLANISITFFFSLTVFTAIPSNAYSSDDIFRLVLDVFFP